MTLMSNSRFQGVGDSHSHRPQSVLGGHADRAHAPGELLLADLHQSSPLHHLC